MISDLFYLNFTSMQVSIILQFVLILFSNSLNHFKDWVGTVSTEKCGLSQIKLDYQNKNLDFFI